MSNWIMPSAAPRDADGLAQCVAAAYQIYIPRMGKPPGPMLADYAEAIRQYQVWAAEAHGEIIGGLALIPDEDYMSLDNIAVHPTYQGQGVGRTLDPLSF